MIRAWILSTALMWFEGGSVIPNFLRSGVAVVAFMRRVSDATPVTWTSRIVPFLASELLAFWLRTRIARASPTAPLKKKRRS